MLLLLLKRLRHILRRPDRPVRYVDLRAAGACGGNRAGCRAGEALSGKSSNNASLDARRGPGADLGRGKQILEERYARGELTTEEYPERLRILEEDGR